MASSSQGGIPPDMREYIVRVPPKLTKRYSVIQFNRGDKVDFASGVPVKMERENNVKLFKDIDSDLPTQGAGSEFGRERREEAKRKKFGIVKKQYKEEDQPWILKMGGKAGKKYKGRKEGLVTENSSYYMFIQLPDKSFAAYPVDSFYNFMPMIQYKTLNAEEAEEEFLRRDRVYNYHSLMIKKRLKEGKEEEHESEKKTDRRKNLRNDNLMLTEDDDFRDLMTSGSDSSEEEEEEMKKKKNKKGSKKEAKEREKKKKKADSEAEEESDEGDFDGREFDYISEESSDDQAEIERKHDIKGVDQELKKIEDDEEQEEEAVEDEEGQDERGEGDDAKEKNGEKKEKKEDDSSSNGSDSSDSDIDDNKIQSAMFLQNKAVKKSTTKNSNVPSRPSTPTLNDDEATKTPTDAPQKLESGKRPGTPLMEHPAAKRVKLETAVPPRARTPPSDSGITEDVVRRYLMRKPMTTKDLLHKLNPKKLGLSLEEVVKRLTDVLRRLNPEQKKIKDKVYWFVQK